MLFSLFSKSPCFLKKPGYLELPPAFAVKYEHLATVNPMAWKEGQLQRRKPPA
jgi:hypothetical protein